MVAITSDSKYIVTGSDDNTIRIWDIGSKKEIAVLKGHTQALTRITITNDDRYIISASHDNTERLWNIKERRQESLEVHFPHNNGS